MLPARNASLESPSYCINAHRADATPQMARSIPKMPVLSSSCALSCLCQCATPAPSAAFAWRQQQVKLLFFPSLPRWKCFDFWVGSVNFCPCVDRQCDGKYVGTGCPSLSLPPPVLTPQSCLAPMLPEMCHTFQAKMVMVKLEKLVETFYQLDHRDLSVLLLCRAQLKPRPNFLGQILKLFVFPWEPREELWARLQPDLCPSTSPPVSLKFMGFFQPDSVKGSLK